VVVCNDRSFVLNDRFETETMKRICAHLCLYGATVHSKIGRLIVIVGASHAKRLETQLKEAGETTLLVDNPNFRRLNRNMADLTAKLKVILEGKKEQNGQLLLPG
jgi:hypothetical protein